MVSPNYHVVIFLLFAGVLIHGIIFFLYRTSAILSLRSFRNSLLLFWLGLLLFFVYIFFIRRSPKDRFRVACFPLVSSEAWLDMVIADGINANLRRANPSVCLAYPLDWSYDAIAVDSASDVSYLRDYGRRIELDLLVTERTDSRFKGGCEIALAFYDLKQGQCLLQVIDTLDFVKPDGFFRRVVRRTLDFASLGCDSFPSIRYLP